MAADGQESDGGARPVGTLGGDLGPISAPTPSWEDRAACLIQASPVAFANLAVLLENAAPAAELVALLRQALALQPDFAEAHGNLGLLLLRSGELGPAIASFRELIRLPPQSAEGYAHLALLA